MIHIPRRKTGIQVKNGSSIGLDSNDDPFWQSALFLNRTFEKSEQTISVGNNRHQFPAVSSPGGEGMVQVGYLHFPAPGIQVIAEAGFHTVFPPVVFLLLPNPAVFLVQADRSVADGILDRFSFCFLQTEHIRSMRNVKSDMGVEHPEDQGSQWGSVLILHHTPHASFPLFRRTPVFDGVGENKAWFGDKASLREFTKHGV